MRPKCDLPSSREFLIKLSAVSSVSRKRLKIFWAKYHFQSQLTTCPARMHGCRLFGDERIDPVGLPFCPLDPCLVFRLLHGRPQTSFPGRRVGIFALVLQALDSSIQV